MVNYEDITFAYLSEVAYATLPGKYSQSESWERVNAALKSTEISSKIGVNWEVFNINGKYICNENGALLINTRDHKIVLVCRGTVTLGEDVIMNDIGGGLHLTKKRAEELGEFAKIAKAFITNQEQYTLTIVGHSLGGSLASEIGRIFDCDTFTYNAPDLRHGLNEQSGNEAKHFNSTKLHAFRLAYDIVSKIGVDDTQALTIESEHHYKGIHAHSIQHLIEALEDSYQTMHGFAPTQALKEVIIRGEVKMNGFEGGLVWSSNKTDTVLIYAENALHQVQFTNHHEAGNLFFTRIVETTVILDRNGNIISQSNDKAFEFSQYHLSKHSQAALDAGRVSAINEALNSLLSQDSKLSLVDLSKHAATAMTKGFATSTVDSYVNEALQNLVATGGVKIAADVISGAIRDGGVDAAYALLHGDKQQALKSAIDFMASNVLQTFLGLPLSYSTNYQVSTGSLFGSRVIYSYEKSYDLGTSSSTVLNRFIGKVSLGLGFNRISDVYRMQNDQLVRCEASGIDGYIRLGPVSASLGVYSGVETYNPITTRHVDANGVPIDRTTWGSKSFEGQVTLRVHTGNRLFVAKLFPALQSTTILYWEEHRADGQDFLVRHSDQNVFLKPTENSFSNAATLDAHEFNLPTFQQYISTLPIKSSGTDNNPLSASDSHSTHPSTLPEATTNTGGGPVQIQTSSALTKFSHAGHINQLTSGLGHTESVTNHFGIHIKEKKNGGATTHVVDKEYDTVAIHEARAKITTLIDDQWLKLSVDRTDFDVLATDTRREHEANTTLGKNHRGNHDIYYSAGQMRTYNNAGITTNTHFEAMRHVDDSDISSTTTNTHNTNGENVVETRRVNELGQETWNSSNGHNGGFTDERGIIETTDEHVKTTFMSVDGTIVTDTYTSDTSFDAFCDIRSETVDGVTTNYESGQNQEYRFEVATQHVNQEVSTMADHSAYSVDNSIGHQSCNGLTTDNATMNVYTKEITTIDTFDHNFDTNGNRIEGDTKQQKIIEKVHGTSTIANLGTTTSMDGKYNYKSVTLSNVKNQYVQGVVSSTMSETTVGSDGNVSTTNYKIGEKDLVLDSKTLVNEYVSSVVAKNGEVLSSTIGPTVTNADGSKTTEIDRITRIDDITIQTANVDSKNGGDPTLTMDALMDLPVEDGGFADGENMAKGKNVKGDIKRNRIAGGAHDIHIDHKTNTRGNQSHLVVSQDTEDFIQPIKIESTIEEGVGETAKLSDTKTTIDSSHTIHAHQHVERTLGIVHIVDKETIVTDITDSTKPEEGTKHQSKSTITASPGSVKASGALAGGISTLMLSWAVDGRPPTVQASGCVLISGIESFLIGNAAAIMDATHDLVSGATTVGGIAAMAATGRITLDLIYGNIEKDISQDRIQLVKNNKNEKKSSQSIEIGSRVEVNAYGSGNLVKGKVVKVQTANNKILYDVQYDLDTETVTINTVASILTSTIQALISSSSVRVASALGVSLGGGAIMLVPILVDTGKVCYHICTKKDPPADGGVTIAANIGSMLAGAAASYGVTTVITTALGTAAALLSSLSGLAIAVAGAVAFSGTAFFAGKAIRKMILRYKDSKRVKELRKKYNIDPKTSQSLQQIKWVVKKLKSTVHPNKGAKKEDFVSTCDDMKEWLELETKLGYFQFYEDANDANGKKIGKIISWVGYCCLMAKQLRDGAIEVTGDLIDECFSHDAYHNFKEATKRNNNSHSQNSGSKQKTD